MGPGARRRQFANCPKRLYTLGESLGFGRSWFAVHHMALPRIYRLNRASQSVRRARKRALAALRGARRNGRRKSGGEP